MDLKISNFVENSRIKNTSYANIFNAYIYVLLFIFITYYAVAYLQAHYKLYMGKIREVLDMKYKSIRIDYIKCIMDDEKYEK